MIRHMGMNKNKPGVIFWVMASFIFLYSGGFAHAYIIPPEQLLEFMIKNFSRINTLVIIQSVLEETSEQSEKVQSRFKEQLWLKSPGFFQSRILEQEWIRPGVRDLSYRRLIMAGKKTEIENYLQGIGIELEQAAFTRIDGTIVFRIGAPGPGRPRLLVEKERFLPLLISYPSREMPGKMVEVRFKDYRQLEKGWYPFEVTYAVGEEIRETFTIQSYELNVPVNPSIFYEEKKRPGT